MQCKQCLKEFDKKGPKDKPRFCSKSCAATYNNIHHQNRYKNRKDKAKPKFCKSCNKEIFTRHRRCEKCTEEFKNKDYKLSEIMYLEYHKSSLYALVRSRARSIGKKLGWIKCYNCGYDKHVEIAHKKSISSFSDDTLLSVVNDVSNLIALCPNCHWEFDHKIYPKNHKCLDCDKLCKITSTRCRDCSNKFRYNK